MLTKVHSLQLCVGPSLMTSDNIAQCYQFREQPFEWGGGGGYSKSDCFGIYMYMDTNIKHECIFIQNSVLSFFLLEKEKGYSTELVQFNQFKC